MNADQRGSTQIDARVYLLRLFVIPESEFAQITSVYICVHLWTFFVSTSRLTPFERRDAQAQRIELDKALGVLLIVGTGIVFERRDILVE